MDLNIRPVAPGDYRATEALTREAFWNVYQPGCDEHYYLHLLRRCPAYLPELDYLAEAEGELVGHIAYAKSKIATSHGDIPAVTFGPVGVLPKHKGRGIGSVLIRHTLRLAQEQGHRAAVILGDPRYYGRFGFHGCERFGLTLPGGKYLPGLLARELVPGALSAAAGCFIEGFEFVKDAQDFDRFDAGFPVKEKAFSESQRDFQVMCGLAYEVREHGFM